MSVKIYLGVFLKNPLAEKITAALLNESLEVLACAQIRATDLVSYIALYPRVTAGIDLPASRGRPSSKEEPAYQIETEQRLPADSALLSALLTAGFTNQPDSPRSYRICRSTRVFQSLLQCRPFAARSLEGRLQRQLVLCDHGVHLPDPFSFFEEITRHHLLTSDLPLDTIYSVAELNALAAAFHVYQAVGLS